MTPEQIKKALESFTPDQRQVVVMIVDRAIDDAVMMTRAQDEMQMNATLRAFLRPSMN
jgi:hypothetical protein